LELRGFNFGGGLSDGSRPAGSRGLGSGGKHPEAEETLQIVYVGRIFCASHVVSKRRDDYITCDAL